MTQQHEPGGLKVRDAVESDAESLAAIADAPPDVMRNVIHDRTVRVAVYREPTDPTSAMDDAEPPVDEDGGESGEGGTDGESREGRESGEDGGSNWSGEGEATEANVVGFVSFDVRGDLVHVTQFGGSREACERLLAEPVRFASKEDLGVEVLVTATDDEMRDAAEAVGFEKKGNGPMFAGERTVRYRAFP